MPTFLENLIAHLKHDQTELRRQIELFASGKMQLQERKGDGTWDDITQKELKPAKEKLAEIDGILARQDKSK